MIVLSILTTCILYLKMFSEALLLIAKLWLATLFTTGRNTCPETLVSFAKFCAHVKIKFLKNRLLCKHPFSCDLTHHDTTFQHFYRFHSCIVLKTRSKTWMVHPWFDRQPSHEAVNWHINSRSWEIKWPRHQTSIKTKHWCAKAVE